MVPGSNNYQRIQAEVWGFLVLSVSSLDVSNIILVVIECMNYKADCQDKSEDLGK